MGIIVKDLAIASGYLLILADYDNKNAKEKQN